MPETSNKSLADFVMCLSNAVSYHVLKNSAFAKNPGHSSWQVHTYTKELPVHFLGDFLFDHVQSRLYPDAGLYYT